MTATYQMRDICSPTGQPRGSRPLLMAVINSPTSFTLGRALAGRRVLA